MTYFKIPLELNPETLIEEIFAQIEAAFPGWEPNPANTEVAIIRSCVYVLFSPLAQLTSEASEEILNRFGEEVAGVLPHESTPASAKVKITVQDTAGYTIPAGTQIDLERTGSEQIGFRTVTAAEVLPGSTSITDVSIEAIEPGSEGNGLNGDASLVDALAYVIAVELEGESEGGEDPEEPEAYLGRLAETMQTFANRPIIARDVAIIARTISGVARAAVIDNYNPETELSEQEKTTTVAPIGPAGGLVGSTVKEKVKNLLDEKREANFLFFVVDPTYTQIDVEAVLVAVSGFSQAEAIAQVEAAIEEFLDPAKWGTGTQQDPAVWENTPTVRFQDVVTVVNNVQAVDHYTTLKIRKHSGSFGTTDVTMDGKIPLPKAGEMKLT